MPYIGVDDCAASLAKAEQLGGKAIAGPLPVPGVGLMGVFTDPQGAHISLMQFMA
jgi:predicted enzyme related to lactoylglutathione lyase